MMKKILFTFMLMLLATLEASAWDFWSGGIYYNITSTSNKSVEVTYKNTDYNNYSGKIDIPATVNYNGNTYVVTAIGSHAFYQCYDLAYVSIPNTVTSIGEDAFSRSALKEVNIGNSLKTIGDYAFDHCSQLQAVILPNSVTTLGQNAFSHCYQLKHVVFGSSLSYIGGYAFYNTKNLESLTCRGTTPASMPSSAFDNDSYSKATLYVPSMSIGAYQGVSMWKYFYKIEERDCDFSVGGYYGNIYYNVIGDHQVEVTYRNENHNSYSGVVGIFKSVEFGGVSYDVVAIGDWAFYECDELTSVLIPTSVWKIGKCAFSYCSSLTDLTLPWTVGLIGQRAFYSCRSLSSMTIPASVSEIEAYTFGQCFALESISLPYTIYKIGESAFSNCQSLTNVTLPSSLLTIGQNAFYQCLGLTSVTIPNSVTTVGYGAFYQCRNLTEVTIGSSVTSIGGDAFYNSTLSRVYCKTNTPASMENSYVFSDGTYNHATLYVPSDKKNLFQSANWWKLFTTIEEFDGDFEYNGIYYNITGENTVEVTYKNLDFNSYSGSVSIPESVPFRGKTYQVTSIGDYAFYYCKNLTSISIPSTVTALGSKAFYNCASLTKLTIPNSVTTIGHDCLAQATRLTDLTIGNSVETIDDYAFYNCYALTSVTIPASVNTIGGYAFYNCTALTTVNSRRTIPPTIQYSTFSTSTYDNATLHVPGNSATVYSTANYWKKFANIQAHDYDFAVNGIYYNIIGGNAVEVTYKDKNYNYNSYSGSVTIPGSVSYNGKTYTVTAIGYIAFNMCSSLTGLTIPNTVTSIGESAFIGCDHLTAITIPSSVTTISKNGFASSGLKEVLIPATVTSLGWGAFNMCDSLKSVAIEAGATYISDYAFATCPSLKSVTIPNTVKTIGEYAFGWCETLPSIALPSSVTSIGRNAFVGCTALKSVTSEAVTPPTMANSDVFPSSVYSNAVLYMNSENRYKAADWWKNFTTVKLSLYDAVGIDTNHPDFVFYSMQHFEEAYQWTNVVEGDRSYIRSGNAGVHRSQSALKAQVMVDKAAVVSFDFKAWGEGSSPIYDACEFYIDGEQQFCWGALQNDWENFSVLLTEPGQHTLMWIYDKDYSVNRPGDYFAIDNLTLTNAVEDVLRGDVDGDGSVTIADVSELVDLILAGDTNVNTCPAADVDGNGSVNIADVSDLVDCLISGNMPAHVFTVAGVSFNMVPVAGGTFSMGNDRYYSSEQPVHQVTLSSYSIGQTEVTQALWLAVMGSNPSRFTGDLNRPVELVSWDDCQVFITKLNQLTGMNFRLPTEAEWEFAARGGKSSQGYLYAGSNNSDIVSWNTNNSGNTTHPVGTKAPNELGLYDMSGNVYEWCQDYYGDYTNEAQTNPTGPASGTNLVCRGGGYMYNVDDCRVTARTSDPSTRVYDCQGFRLAL